MKDNAKSSNSDQEEEIFSVNIQTLISQTKRKNVNNGYWKALNLSFNELEQSLERVKTWSSLEYNLLHGFMPLLILVLSEDFINLVRDKNDKNKLYYHRIQNMLKNILEDYARIGCKSRVTRAYLVSYLIDIKHVLDQS